MLFLRPGGFQATNRDFLSNSLIIARNELAIEKLRVNNLLGYISRNDPKETEKRWEKNIDTYFKKRDNEQRKN